MEKPAVQESAATPQQEKLTFKEMSSRQKFVYVCRLMVTILSFGFIFPSGD